ncbi:hypothetical protein [Tanticharoenia sakaeratensis]|uniref:Secreted protein n=1 Tax=Tanticharoenia sakaeratensis NBRC 103193 TaxID=1231623 RepID=A0A0D6MMU7_9PROT|nr:hypothetical protein [Tanticharoenia sakaeratensis]GAN54999.1 hypothetical protein Tasa_036_017 [Tanticharoenia sakaeratensis NBRC 103193]GBQ20418.1 hypothetical protein AA103193_1373 [Tanticharoenia sakaeratensis NBRC 103193]
MRALSSVITLLCLIVATAHPALADDAARTAPTNPAMHGSHACLFQHMLIHTAYRPSAPPQGCASGASRIGAGYTRLLSTSALRHPHTRLRA